MLVLQLLVTIPSWALERGLNERTFNILEEIVLNPKDKDLILANVEDGDACCIKQALEFAESKGLLK